MCTADRSPVSAAMAAAREPAAVIARSSARHLYWSLAQQIAHLTSNGATLRAGDLLGSGTVSGPEQHERGCLLELAWNGEEPLRLPDGKERAWLADGDEVVAVTVDRVFGARTVHHLEVRVR